MKCTILRTKNLSLEYTSMENEGLGWYDEHEGHGMYLWETQTWRAMIIDDTLNIKDIVYMSVIYKHEKRWYDDKRDGP